MLQNTENIASLSFQILYIFVLRAEKVTNFGLGLPRKWQLFPRVIQIFTKFANFAGPYFTTFCHPTGNSTNFNILFLAVVKDFVNILKVRC